jgi:hypothetical protein
MGTATFNAAELSLPLQWIEFEETPIHFRAQHQPNEFVLTFGQVTGPTVVRTPEQIREQARGLSRVPIQTLSRTGLTRDRLVGLIGILQPALEEHDRSHGSS